MIKEPLRHTFLYDFYRALREKRALRQWQKSDQSTNPPHVVKQNTLKEYGARFHLPVLVETGTFMGHMVQAMRASFSQIYSIELDEALFCRAAKKFAKYPQIEILHGDSASVLPQLLKRLDQPCLFWLDGHYSAGSTARGAKDSPAMEELRHIVEHRVREHVVLIDDARCFGTDAGYPPLGELKELVTSYWPHHTFEIRHDIIRIYPGAA